MFSILDEVYGWIVSMRYTGYLCFRILYALKPILNCILYLTGRQTLPESRGIMSGEVRKVFFM